jgi:energy-coupling factor transporter ATP-binding protein EcfA2
MDEPTNFLDLESVESLIAATNKFPGALLVVTHSRHFLRKCAKTFLSITPGQFLSFTDMQAAEAATYTFIQELESGVKIDTSAMAAGGGSLHAKAGETKTVSIHVADGAAPKFAVGDEVLALWTDKKYYPGTVMAVTTNPIKYSVMYPAFNKKANVPEAGVKVAPMSVAKERALAQRAEAEAKAQVASAHKFSAGERCLCMKADGRFYAAKIIKVNGFDMFVVQFEKPLEEVTVPLKKLRIFNATDATPVTAKPKPKKPVAKPARGAQRQDSA